MAVTPAGERDRRIVFRRPTVTAGELGGDETVFVDAVRAMAKILYGTGSERRDAAAAGAVQSATFRVLSTARVREVTERWRIGELVSGGHGAEWGIGSISRIGRTEIEFVATRIASA